MRDRDTVFMYYNLPDGGAAEPISFRIEDVYRYDQVGKRTHVVPKLRQQLKALALAGLLISTTRDSLRSLSIEESYSLDFSSFSKVMFDSDHAPPFQLLVGGRIRGKDQNQSKNKIRTRKGVLRNDRRDLPAR